MLKQQLAHGGIEAIGIILLTEMVVPFFCCGIAIYSGVVCSLFLLIDKKMPLRKIGKE
jgi:hypothetical protein